MNGYFEGNRSRYCYLLICGLYCLLATIHLTAFLSFDCQGFYFFEFDYASNQPKVSEFIYFEVKAF